MRMLDADAEGADWREVARIVLHIDPDRGPDRARQAFALHAGKPASRPTSRCKPARKYRIVR
jgi:hypothetical protein